MQDLCYSCGGPLDQFDQDKVVNHLCPYCADENGNVRSYGDILEGMIEYITKEHPEIKESDRAVQAQKWLEEGPIWGAIWKGVVIAECLENEDILEQVKITGTEKSDMKDDPDNGGYDIWTLHEFEIKRSGLDDFVNLLKSNIKDGGWWVDIKKGKDCYIIFQGKSFAGSMDDSKYTKEVNDYARSVGVPEEQLPFQVK